MMPGDEQGLLRELLVKVARVEEKIDAMNGARDMAFEALQSTKSGHHRLDSVEGDIKWLWRTSLGAIIVSVLGFFIKKG